MQYHAPAAVAAAAINAFSGICDHVCVYLCKCTCICAHKRTRTKLLIILGMHLIEMLWHFTAQKMWFSLNKVISTTKTKTTTIMLITSSDAAAATAPPPLSAICYWIALKVKYCCCCCYCYCNHCSSCCNLALKCQLCLHNTSGIYLFRGNLLIIFYWFLLVLGSISAKSAQNSILKSIP